MAEKALKVALGVATAVAAAATAVAVHERGERRALEAQAPEPPTPETTPHPSEIDPSLLEATVETRGHSTVVLFALAAVAGAGLLVTVFTVPPAFVAPVLAFGPVILFAFLVLVAHWRIHHPPTAE